jgi:tryptophan-rich sensory protein
MVTALPNDGSCGVARVAAGGLRRCEKFPLALFAIQLVLNSLWSVLFFGLQNPGAAAIEIILLWVAIVATTVAFFRCSKWAGGLLVPYLVWVSYAAVLNFTIWQMNVG